MIPLARTTRAATGLLVGASVAMAVLPASGIEYDEIVLTRDQPTVTIHLDELLPTSGRLDAGDEAIRPDTCAPEPDCAVVPIRVDAEMAADEAAVVVLTIAWPQHDVAGEVNALPDIDAWMWAHGTDCEVLAGEPEPGPEEEAEEEEDPPLADPPEPPDSPDVRPAYDGCVVAGNVGGGTNPIVFSTGSSFVEERLVVIANYIGPNREGVDVTAELAIAPSRRPEPPLPGVIVTAPTSTADAPPTERSAPVRPPGPDEDGADGVEGARLRPGDDQPPAHLADLIAAGATARPPSVLDSAPPPAAAGAAVSSPASGGFASASTLAVLGLVALPMASVLRRRQEDGLPTPSDEVR